MQNRDLYFLLYSVSGNHNSRNPVALSIPNDEARQWMLDVPRNEVACLDVETTGLYPHQTDEVLQISICDGNGKMLLNTYVHPARRKRWPNAQSVHGITPAMVKDSRTLLELSDEIRKIIVGCTLLIGYNVRNFDLEFLKAGGVDLPRYFKVYDLIDDCSVLYSHWNKNYGNYTYISLENVARKLNVEYSPHDSSEDVQATVKVFYKMLNSVKMRNAVKKAESARVDDKPKPAPANITKTSVKTVSTTPSSTIKSPPKPKPKVGCLTAMLMVMALFFVILMLMAIIAHFT
jgi:DNA polymerase-3 subunit epsilon